MTAAESIAFAFGAGLATFAAPCVFPLLPGYLGYYADRHGGAGTTRPVRQGLAAAAGVLAVFAALVSGVYVFDSRVLASAADLEPVAGGAVAALGLLMLTGHAPAVRVALPRRRDSALGVVAFGGVYAVAAAGCTVSVLLAVVAQALSMQPLAGATVVAAYALGVALPMVAATVAVGYGYDRVTGAVGVSTATFTRVAGAVMLVAGLVQLRAGLALGS